MPENQSQMNQVEQPVEEQRVPIPEYMLIGGKGMSILLMLVSAFMTWQSLILHKKDASLAGYATIPLLLSILIFVLAALDLWKSRKEVAVSWASVKRTIAEILPIDTLIVLGGVLVYVISMSLGLNFIIASLVFMIAAMCYMIRGQIVKNIVVSVIAVALIYFIFKICFKIFLP